MSPSSKKILSVVLTQEHKKFLHKFFDRYLECPTASERRATANIAADRLIAQFAIAKKDDATVIRSVSPFPTRKRRFQFLYQHPEGHILSLRSPLSSEKQHQTEEVRAYEEDNGQGSVGA